MSRQKSMFEYLKKPMGEPKKKIKKDVQRQVHQSSKEGSEATQRLNDSQPDVPLDVYERGKMVCTAFILITPSVLSYYPKIDKVLRELSDRYSKEKVLDFMLDNLKHHRIANLNNLKLIEDDDFWSLWLPIIIELIHNNMRCIEAKVHVIPQGSQQVVDLTRMQVFVILGCMFLGILPKQIHEDDVHFGQLMTIHDNDRAPNKTITRCEKLKCFIAYFKAVAQDNELLSGNVRLQRTKNQNTDFMDVSKVDKEVPLRAIQFRSMNNSSIEDYCGKGIMTDFANRKLGGGVLRNGCVQEQILFSIFPEAVVSKIICRELDDDEAVIIYGARRFSKYSGYSDSFKFEGLSRKVSEMQAEKSVIVAIDATDFASIPSSFYQYSKKGIRREISKAMAGFEGAGLDADEEMPIVTGRWGCGAFRGDEQLKFLIQWVAASQASREMVYITETEEMVRELELVFKQLKFSCTLDIVGILDQYYRCRTKYPKYPTVFQYLKNYAT